MIYDLASSGVTVFVTTHYMDEAEYCERVGIMREGKLLAMDTPGRLKKEVLSGDVWQISVTPLTDALNDLPAMDGVLQAGLSGDYVRAITDRSMTARGIQKRLQDRGLDVRSVERAEPTLEDVFLRLARG